MPGELTLDVYVSDYKPIPGDPAVMSEGQATWPPLHDSQFGLAAQRRA